jgi:hypothetical protein
MATMFPDDIGVLEEATEGERAVFLFLQEAAKPHKDCNGYFQPCIGGHGKQPDFVLVCRTLGILVIEVKDWTIHQIQQANHDQFTVYSGGEYNRRTNPDKQARGYVNTLKQQLEKTREFLSTDPRHTGKLKIPIGRMVAFPNITQRESRERGLQDLIPPERALFKKDIDPGGPIVLDTSGQKFIERISHAFPFQTGELSQKDLDLLHSRIYPEIDLPERKGCGKTHFQTRVQTLDGWQARAARRLKGGHQIIKGPPGSGKTLVLVHRCCHLSEYQSQRKRMLFVCFNIALVSYLKRLLQEKGLGVGKNGIRVCHFFELCSDILQEPVHFEQEGTEYYDLVKSEALERVLEDSPVEPFDAIFIDEGQDFDDEMFKTVLGLLRRNGDLVIALDDYQDLYRRAGSWKALGIDARGRSRHLRNAYRSTAEIHAFTQRFLGYEPDDQKQLSLLPQGYGFHGQPPKLVRFKDQEKLEDFVVSDIREWLVQEEYRRSEIGIVYDDKVYSPETFEYGPRELPRRLQSKLEASGIPAKWVSRDVRAKEDFDITTDRVSLISIHSAKGLDFDLVYLVGADHLIPTAETKDRLMRTLYVAMTRAKHRLVIPYVEETEFINRMQRVSRGEA